MRHPVIAHAHGVVRFSYRYHRGSEEPSTDVATYPQTLYRPCFLVAGAWLVPMSHNVSARVAQRPLPRADRRPWVLSGVGRPGIPAPIIRRSARTMKASFMTGGVLSNFLSGDVLAAKNVQIYHPCAGSSRLAGPARKGLRWRNPPSHGGGHTRGDGLARLRRWGAGDGRGEERGRRGPCAAWASQLRRWSRYAKQVGVADAPARSLCSSMRISLDRAAPPWGNQRRNTKIPPLPRGREGFSRSPGSAERDGPPRSRARIRPAGRW
jgi:hypothetical protein